MTKVMFSFSNLLEKAPDLFAEKHKIQSTLYFCKCNRQKPNIQHKCQNT